MKIFAIILTIMMLLLCSCQSVSNIQDDGTVPSTSSLQFNIEIQIGDNLSTYREYEEFFKVNSFPHKCPHYNDLQHFGEFYNFYYHLTTFEDQNNRYFTYTLRDDSKMFVNLTYSSELRSLTRYEPYLTEDDVQLSDMRHSKKGGVFYYHGLHYLYYGDGRLKEIFWFDEDTTYDITWHNDTFSQGFSEYPYGLNTTISELLNLDGKTEDCIWALINGDIR